MYISVPPPPIPSPTYYTQALQERHWPGLVHDGSRNSKLGTQLPWRLGVQCGSRTGLLGHLADPATHRNRTSEAHRSNDSRTVFYYATTCFACVISYPLVLRIYAQGSTPAAISDWHCEYAPNETSGKFDVGDENLLSQDRG